ncbi:MAG: pantothenate kinase, partial [Phototrophicales bacterium]
MALLCIDIGNTNIHFGIWMDKKWRVSWRARTVADKMADEYASLLRSFLRSDRLSFRHVSGVAISSVVPALNRTFNELVTRHIGVEPLFVTAHTRMGIGIEIDQPEQAGADRLVNAAAVVALYGAPAIVIDFGTATTFDVISGSNAYRGGAIAPGINLAHDALVRSAAQLHKIDLKAPPSPIGANTIHAMQSGIFLGYVGLIEGLVSRIKAAMTEDKPICVIATGGLASLFQQATPAID